MFLSTIRTNKNLVVRYAGAPDIHNLLIPAYKVAQSRPANIPWLWVSMEQNDVGFSSLFNLIYLVRLHRQ